MKKTMFLIVLFLLFSIISCDNMKYSDGTITINFAGLDNLTNYSTTSSNIFCKVFEKENDAYTIVSGSYFEGTASNPLYSSFYFGVGNPDYMFTGGTVYYIEIQIDINGNDVFDDLDTDYWLKSLIEVAIDGNSTVDVNYTDFLYRF